MQTILLQNLRHYRKVPTDPMHKCLDRLCIKFEQQTKSNSKIQRKGLQHFTFQRIRCRGQTVRIAGKTLATGLKQDFRGLSKVQRFHRQLHTLAGKELFLQDNVFHKIEHSQHISTVIHGRIQQILRRLLFLRQNNYSSVEIKLLLLHNYQSIATWKVLRVKYERCR